MRKHRKITINNYNNDIDYDKLAEAIVKAQRKAEEFDFEEVESETKVTLLDIVKAVYLLLFNKSETKGLTNDIFAMLTSLLFKGIGTLGVVFSPIVIIACLYFAYDLDWTFDVVFNNLIYLFSYTLIAGFAGLIFMFSVMLIGASREIQKEKDKNYIIAIFSGVVSFAALVVALIALLNGGSV